MQRIYGIHAVDSLLRRQPRSVQRLLLQEGRQDKRMGALEALARNQGVTYARLPRRDLDALVQGRHQGVIAETVQGTGEDATSNLLTEAALLEKVAASDKPVLLLVLDGVTDPHNLGACLRSADAAGVDAVIVPKDKAAGLTDTVRKVACGAAEVVPLASVSNVHRTLEALKALGIWLYGAVGEADKSIYNSELTGPLAIVMGAEGKGLRRLTRECCDHLVSLPMAGSVSSLNVSVATGICLFEAVRQRQEGPE